MKFCTCNHEKESSSLKILIFKKVVEFISNVFKKIVNTLCYNDDDCDFFLL